MKLLFNHHKQGQAEIVKSLGFLSSDFSYARLRTYINLETPKLIDFLGKKVYAEIIRIYQTLPELVIDKDEDAYYDDKAGEAYYNSGDFTDEQKNYIEVIQLAQVYVGILAYSKYAPNNDLRHTTSGRKMAKDNNEATPWEWQIAKSDASLQKIGYTTLDRLIVALEESKLPVWLESSARKKANSLFVNNTFLFNSKFPINNSDQLYFRCVPLMEDIELLEIESRLGAELFQELKTGTDLELKKLVIRTIVQEIIVYETLIKAYRLFPIEMFPDKIEYSKKAKSNTAEMVKENAIIHLGNYLKQKYVRLEKLVSEYNDTDNDEYQQRDFTQGLQENTKHIDL